MNTYIVVTWPEIQYYMDLPGFDENSYLINDEKGLSDFGSSAYFINRRWCILSQNLLKERIEKVNYFHIKRKLDKIIKLICDRAQITVDDFKSENRKRKFVRLREIYAKLTRDRGFSLKNIGRAINKHHSTVCNALIKFDSDMADPSFELEYDVMKNLLKDNNI